ncbi:hypothetical protein ASD11_12600 [Aeromicrobium sp. Root495]|uniref:hypothetical protein n=1 Tax=Aeromicrobium sp. Root495 TaxID=1736550 RepID=UPI0006FAB44C|nr:hypothetical protein [Aeromicrobium sp. Root495]KQY60292.1 hypothetical protein ASD11_12600 [Aeromicrobium sp. Root495]
MPSEPEDLDLAALEADRRRRRAAALLGDLLPETTSDESGQGWGDVDGGGSRDDELTRDVPPHHGG